MTLTCSASKNPPVACARISSRTTSASFCILLPDSQRTTTLTCAPKTPWSINNPCGAYTCSLHKSREALHPQGTSRIVRHTAESYQNQAIQHSKTLSTTKEKFTKLYEVTEFTHCQHFWSPLHVTSCQTALMGTNNQQNMPKMPNLSLMQQPRDPERKLHTLNAFNPSQKPQSPNRTQTVNPAKNTNLTAQQRLPEDSRADQVASSNPNADEIGSLESTSVASWGWCSKSVKEV